MLLDFLKNKNIKKNVCNSLLFDNANNISLCPFNKFEPIIKNYDGIWLDADKIIEKISLFYNTEHPECNNCPYLKNDSNKKTCEIENLYLSNWHYCYVDCKYCYSNKEEDLVKAKHYDILPSIKTLLDKKLITKHSNIIFECGDASVHPEFDKILFFLINYGMKNVIINTPAFRYCESIAQAIAQNIAKVIIPIDSGCAYIYEKIKGLGKYEIAMNTIKRYLAFQEPSQTRVILKYTIVQGINDNPKEILDWFILSRDLGVKKLCLDIDANWNNQLKNSIPAYLKDLILFAKNMSAYNNLEIEFSPRLDIIYKRIAEQ